MSAIHFRQSRLLPRATASCGGCSELTPRQSLKKINFQNKSIINCSVPLRAAVSRGCLPCEEAYCKIFIFFSNRHCAAAAEGSFIVLRDRKRLSYGQERPWGKSASWILQCVSTRQYVKPSRKLHHAEGSQAIVVRTRPPQGKSASYIRHLWSEALKLDETSLSPSLHSLPLLPRFPLLPHCPLLRASPC